jgi:hypothetical protein
MSVYAQVVDLVTVVYFYFTIITNQVQSLRIVIMELASCLGE